ncbi:hypothetical protein [Sphingomonas lacusdianchii]|jgi:hypothetical protein|uniref:hypothetical protein n=1 Tax=Sphingomonas lacusdianchii TaxID=2917992 RepID=UPI001F595312|nr:hypothetical protein [Sphingomonas sp. JXJ CY 53]
MVDDDTTTVLDEANAGAVRMMLTKLSDHDLVDVFETLGGRGPIADLAADQMRDRNVDF